MRYVQLAHNVWDPQAGHAKAKVLYSFGREDKLDTKALRRLAHSIDVITGSTGQESSESQSADIPSETQHDFVGSRPFGSYWAFDRVWKDLKIDQAIATAARGRPFYPALERTAFALVNAYAGLGTFWAEQASPPPAARVDGYPPDLDSMPVSQITRSLTFLREVGDALQQDIAGRAAFQWGLKVDPLFVGSTPVNRLQGESVFPAGEIRVAVTGEGLPVRCWYEEDPATAPLAADQLHETIGRGKTLRLIEVFPAVTPKPTEAAGPSAGKFITFRPIRDEDRRAAWLSHPGRYRRVLPYLDAKELPSPRESGRGEGNRHILIRNHRLQAQADAERRKVLDELEDELTYLEALPQASRQAYLLHLQDDPAYEPYLRLTGAGAPNIRWSRAKDSARFDGKSCLETSELALSTQEIARGYQAICDALTALQEINGFAPIRRFTHRPEAYAEAHLLLCWLALFIVRHIEFRTQQPWRSVRASLNRMHVGAFAEPKGTVLQRTEATAEQTEIFQRLSIPMPPRILTGVTSNPQQTA